VFVPEGLVIILPRNY